MASSPHISVSGTRDGGTIQPLHGNPSPRCARDAHWTLPGEARLLVNRGMGQVAVAIGNRVYDDLPDIAIIGPTSRPRALWSDGEPPMEFVLSALDWNRISETSADRVADRIVTPDDVGMGPLADDLIDMIRTARPHIDIAQTAHAIIARYTANTGARSAAQIRSLMTIVDEGRIVDAAIAAAQLGIAPHALRRMALRYFGFPAKTILIRRRFLIALKQFDVAGMDIAAAIACGYFDASHFLRDSKRFLGTTPRRFMAMTGSTHIL